MMSVIASSAAPADFLSDPISSARAATSWVLVIGFAIFGLLVLPVRWGAFGQFSGILIADTTACVSKITPLLHFVAVLSLSQERGLLEGPQFPGMDAFERHGTKRFHRPDSDQEMARHLRAVEVRRHAGKLQFAVQRLVGDAEQRAVGHPEAEAVGGDGGRLHVERDGAGLAE